MSGWKGLENLCSLEVLLPDLYTLDWASLRDLALMLPDPRAGERASESTGVCSPIELLEVGLKAFPTDQLGEKVGKRVNLPPLIAGDPLPEEEN